MLYNFKKAFQKKENDEKVTVPKEVIKSLDKSLPKGLVHKEIGDGIYGVFPDDSLSIDGEKKLLLKNLVFQDIPEDCHAKNMNELMKYIYCTQRPIKFKADKDSSIKIGSHKLKLDELVKTPLGDSKKEERTFAIVPAPFEPYKITISGRGVCNSILMTRKPCKDLKHVIVENIDDTTMTVKFDYNTVTTALSASLTVNIENIDTTSVMLDALKLQGSFFDRTIEIDGKKVFANGTISKQSFDENENRRTIKFWEKIEKLERVLGEKFKFSLPMSQDDLHILLTLYYSLVKREPYKEYGEFSKMNLKFSGSIDYSKVKDATSFVYQGEDIIKDFGIEKKIYKVIGVYDIMVKKIIKSTKEQGNLILKFAQEPDVKSYTSTIYTLDKGEADAFCKKDEALKKARLLRDLNADFEKI